MLTADGGERMPAQVRERGEVERKQVKLTDHSINLRDKKYMLSVRRIQKL